MLDAGNREILGPHCLAHEARRDMSDFYEELADFAAMSEDDGFLGHCAGAGAYLPARSTEAGKSGECWIAPERRGPRQLQLLVVLERTTRTF